MRDVSIIVPYYDFPEVAKFQLDNWSSFSLELRKHIHVILVDDGSPNRPFTMTDHPLNLSAYRIHEDIFFNTSGARNLGAAMARTEWLYFTQVEYIIDESNLRKLLTFPLDTNTVYLPLRKRWDGTDKVIVKPKFERKLSHPCNMVIERDRFWDVGAWDEDFAGSWGAEDSHLMRRVEASMKVVRPWQDVWVRDVDPLAVPGSQIDKTVKWGESRSKVKAGAKNKRLAQEKGLTHSSKFLRFDWSLIARRRV